MPWDEVMHKFKHGDLHSGSKKGPKVSSRDQAVAIMMSEKSNAEKGKKEYESKKGKSKKMNKMKPKKAKMKKPQGPAKLQAAALEGMRY